MLILNVDKTIAIEDKMKITVKEDIPGDVWDSLKPEGTMLVDSEGKAFVYLLENTESFHHLRFSQQQWPVLAEVLQEEKPLMLYGDDKNKSIEISNFWSELKLLLQNIKGNKNYGHSFVQSVEETFS